MAKVKHVNVGTGIETLEEWMGEGIHVLTEEGELIISAPPSTFHKIYNLYAKKTGDNYHLVMVVESEPET